METNILSEAGKNIVGNTLERNSSSSRGISTYTLAFQFDLNELLNFIFPSNLQHPLTNSRLFIFGLYGPLDDRGLLRSGKGGKHILMEYELDQMCQQIEREDLIEIYMHRARDAATLTTPEQDAIINQADAHLKKAKGKAMLPQMTREEIIDLLVDFPRDSDGRLNFHEVQNFLRNLRTERVKQLKLVYPQLTNKNKKANDNQSMTSSYNPFKDPNIHATTLSLGSLESVGSMSMAESRNHKQKMVSSAVAPQTMFQRNKGLNNAGLVDEVSFFVCFSIHSYSVLFIIYFILDNEATDQTRK
jgi:hypothetical protein